MIIAAFWNRLDVGLILGRQPHNLLALPFMKSRRCDHMKLLDRNRDREKSDHIDLLHLAIVMFADNLGVVQISSAWNSTTGEISLLTWNAHLDHCHCRERCAETKGLPLVFLEQQLS